MTILNGKEYTFETFDQFCELLGVSLEETTQSLPKSTQLAINKQINEYRAEDDLDPIDDLSEADPDILREEIQTRYTNGELILKVLRHRDQPYSHIYTNGLHRVVEIYNNQIGNLTQQYSVFEVNSDFSTNAIGNLEASSHTKARAKAADEYGAPVEVR